MLRKKSPLCQIHSQMTSSITNDSALQFYTAKNLQTDLTQTIKHLNKLQTSLMLNKQAKDHVWHDYFRQMSKIGDKLLEAVIKKNKSQLTRLLTEFPIDVSDFLYMDGWSLLHFSITTNDVDIILILLRHGIDVNIQSKEMRRTALHEAVLSNRMEIVRLLIDSGANPNLTDADRNTAIHLSVDYGYVQIIEIILNSKIPVQLSLTNCNNMTPFNNCRTASILQLLLKYYSSTFGSSYILNENATVYNYQSRLRIHQQNIIPNISRVDQVQKLLSLQQNSHKLRNPQPISHKCSVSSGVSIEDNSEEKSKEKKKKESKGVGSYLKNKNILKYCNRASQNIGLRRETIYQSYIKDEEQIENYEIIKKLGAGAFSEVFMARKKRSSNIFALKKIDKKLVISKNLQNYVRTEKHVLTSINHPFILKGFVCMQDFTHLFLVVQLCEGGDMQKYIRQSPLSQALAKTYACEVALALDELHKHNILYRDLKVSNILLDKHGHLKLADFGLAKQALSTDSFVGSVSYIPPELLVEGIKKPHNKSVDWYLLGVFIYQLLHGEPVFYNADRTVMENQILNVQPTFSPSISLQCQEVMTRLLDKNPQSRLSNLQDLKALKWFDGVDWQKILKKQGQVMKIDIDCRSIRRKDYFSVQFKQKQIDPNIQWYHDWNYPIKQ